MLISKRHTSGASHFFFGFKRGRRLIGLRVLGAFDKVVLADKQPVCVAFGGNWHYTLVVYCQCIVEVSLFNQTKALLASSNRRFFLFCFELKILIQTESTVCLSLTS
jgi:hypothetical protein